MPRSLCAKCARPEKVCICSFIEVIDNQVELAILQHPSESQQIKGTAIIADLSLVNSQLWIGESLDDLPGLVDWLSDESHVLLLYPPIEGQIEPYNTISVSTTDKTDLSGIKVLVIDGTWRKTYKMMQLNKSLRALDRIELKPAKVSNYQVRKQKDGSSLSTIEAIYEVMSQLERDEQKFQPLLNTFEAMQKQQLAFRRAKS